MITSAETMYRAILEAGIIPFFRNPIQGYSIEELTAPEYWFDGDAGVLGPWDWKIDCIQSGDIVYGKFLGGKAAFATVEWYREIRAWRLSRLSPDTSGQKILDFIGKNGAISIKEVRELLGVKKAAADSAIARLQMQCRVVTGDIQRVYRGEDLHYNGWQVSSFTTPEALFGNAGDFPWPFRDDADPLATEGTPEDSLERLIEHIGTVSGCTDRKTLIKLIR